LSRVLTTFSLAVAAFAVLATFAVLGLVLAGRLTFGAASDAMGVLTGFRAACTPSKVVELERLREEAHLRAEYVGEREFREALHATLRRSRADRAEFERLKEETHLREEDARRRAFAEALGGEFLRSRRARLASELLEAQAATRREELKSERAEVERMRAEALAEIERRNEGLASRKAAQTSESTKSLARLYARMDSNLVADEIVERWNKGEKLEIAAVLRAMGEHAASSVLEGVTDSSLRTEIVRGAWSGIR